MTELPVETVIAHIRAMLEAGTIRRFETAFGRAETLQAYNHYLGAPDRVTWDLDRYRKTTAENIRATVAAYLTPSNVLTVITNPAAAKGTK